MNRRWGGPHSRRKRNGGIGGVARAIKPQGRLLVGILPDGRGGMIATEGEIERDFVRLMLFDPTVTKIISQPIAIYYAYWPDSDPIHVRIMEEWDRRAPAGAVYCGQPHYPDFLVHRADRRPLLVEVKQERQVHHFDVRRKAAAAQAFATLAGYEYRLVTDQVLRRGFLLNNVKELWRHADFAVPFGCKLRIHEVLALSGGEASYEVLLHLLVASGFDRSTAVKSIYRLLWNRELQGDLSNQPLGPGFHIRAATAQEAPSEVIASPRNQPPAPVRRRLRGAGND